eukprot:5038535-Amphidinium_carterae.1
MHQTVEAGPEAAPPENANQKPSLCQTLGICLCSAAGKEVVRFHKSLQKFQKACFHQPKDKDLLAKGFVVVCLQSVCPPGATMEGFVAEEHYFPEVLPSLNLSSELKSH